MTLSQIMLATHVFVLPSVVDMNISTCNGARRPCARAIRRAARASTVSDAARHANLPRARRCREAPMRWGRALSVVARQWGAVGAIEYRRIARGLRQLGDVAATWNNSFFMRSTSSLVRSLSLTFSFLAALVFLATASQSLPLVRSYSASVADSHACMRVQVGPR